MTNFVLPIYAMIALMVFIFIVMIVVVVAVIVLLIKAIRYSGNNDLRNKTFKNKNENKNAQNTNTFRYDPYSMDDVNGSNHCPQCNENVTSEFHYCPKCGTELKAKKTDNIVKIKVN